MMIGAMRLNCMYTGYVKALHRPENEVILLHVPEVFDGDRSSKYCTHWFSSLAIILFVAIIET